MYVQFVSFFAVIKIQLKLISLYKDKDISSKGW